MRYHKFNRKRPKDILKKYRESTRKGLYQIYTDRSRMLDSGFFENQTWGALHKCWKGYTIALNHYEVGKMIEYAERIQRLQHDLGIHITEFPNLGMSRFGNSEESAMVLDNEISEDDVESILNAQLEEFRKMKEEDRYEPSFGYSSF